MFPIHDLQAASRAAVLVNTQHRCQLWRALTAILVDTVLPQLDLCGWLQSGKDGDHLLMQHQNLQVPAGSSNLCNLAAV